MLIVFKLVQHCAVVVTVVTYERDQSQANVNSGSADGPFRLA